MWMLGCRYTDIFINPCGNTHSYFNRSSRYWVGLANTISVLKQQLTIFYVNYKHYKITKFIVNKVFTMEKCFDTTLLRDVIWRLGTSGKIKKYIIGNRE